MYAHIDDFLVASSSPTEHLDHLNLLFTRLQEYGIIINPDKCCFGQASLGFLGHLIAPGGISPLPQKVRVILDFPPPTSLKKLREFLGLINFYRRFIPNCAKILQPLTDLLSPKVTKDVLKLHGDSLLAFDNIKCALADATLLSHPSADAPYSLVVGAPNVAVGAVLQQNTNGL